MLDVFYEMCEWMTEIFLWSLRHQTLLFINIVLTAQFTDNMIYHSTKISAIDSPIILSVGFVLAH